MLDINKYRLYIRDVSLKDDELKLLIQDILNDIASTTYIFKEIVGFTLEPGIQEYNFKSLLNMNEKVEEGNINNITIGSYTENDLINFLSNNNDSKVDIITDIEYGISLNTFLNVDNIAYLYFDELLKINKLIECYKDFKVIGDGIYRYKYRIEEEVQAIAIINIVPNIDNITAEIELIIKPVIIEGLRYFGNTSMAGKDEQTRYNSWARFNKAKLGLMSRYPTMTNLK